jgi:hypothetical protein
MAESKNRDTDVVDHVDGPHVPHVEARPALDGPAQGPREDGFAVWVTGAS